MAQPPSEYLKFVADVFLILAHTETTTIRTIIEEEFMKSIIIGR